MTTAYRDDIVFVAASEVNLRYYITLNLIKINKGIGLIINESETKYIILSRKDYN